MIDEREKAKLVAKLSTLMLVLSLVVFITGYVTGVYVAKMPDPPSRPKVEPSFRDGETRYRWPNTKEAYLQRIARALEKKGVE